eukprot:639051-Amphidinium_carterae.1
MSTLFTTGNSVARTMRKKDEAARRSLTVQQLSCLTTPFVKIIGDHTLREAGIKATLSVSTLERMVPTCKRWVTTSL